MYCVYWLYKPEGASSFETRHQFADEITIALKLCETLRATRNCCFITLASENPGMVGKHGVDVTGADYNWTKRRTTELRKDKKVVTG